MIEIHLTLRCNKSFADVALLHKRNDYENKRKDFYNGMR